MPFEHYEIDDLLNAVNCLLDIQRLAGAWNDYPELFPPIRIYKETLLLMAELFIN